MTTLANLREIASKHEEARRLIGACVKAVLIDKERFFGFSLTRGEQVFVLYIAGDEERNDPGWFEVEPVDAEP